MSFWCTQKSQKEHHVSDLSWLGLKHERSLTPCPSGILRRVRRNIMYRIFVIKSETRKITNSMSFRYIFRRNIMYRIFVIRLGTRETTNSMSFRYIRRNIMYRISGSQYCYVTTVVGVEFKSKEEIKKKRKLTRENKKKRRKQENK